MDYKLYLHTTPNGKMYFGITCQKVEVRWQNGRGYIGNDHFTKAINKYGWNNIEHLVLADNLTKEEACHYEEVLIAYFDTTNREKGYNHSSGGELNLHSEETKRKMSEAHKGKPGTRNGCTVTEETRRKLSEANKGKKKPPITEETRRKLSEAHKGINSRANKTEEEIQEWKNKISAANKGKTGYWEGKNRTEETKVKISQSAKAKGCKKVRCIELNKIFDSIYKANAYFGKSYYSNNINNSIKRKGTAFGYHWEYIKEAII